MAVLTFVATVYKVQTLVDNGIRLTLDLPETAIAQMAQLADCQRQGLVLLFEATEHKQESLTYLDDETKKDTEGSGPALGGRRQANRRDQRSRG